MIRFRCFFCFAFFCSVCVSLNAQQEKKETKTKVEKSVKPGINKSFVNVNPQKFVERFEREGREVYDQREQIIKAIKLKPGTKIADIGAGTGLFTRLFSPAVGQKGHVYAVDISKNFIKHITLSCKEKGMENVTGIVCVQDDVKLAPQSIDVAFVCATYHHFEYPNKTLTSIHRALRPQGKLIVIDFDRKKNVSSEWILKHVRAGKKTVLKEILSNKFKLVEEKKLFKKNYFLQFVKE
ncbi:hypothetical protein MNBD_PLANCTO02-966 [hydrothermal vent metagenome]|uniref:Methyltransferase domain-containing protein n=1 Tax=hydrothermal vent metagenome TaxID=652676 RepID=A0A3B1DCH4_9ZZZZ